MLVKTLSHRFGNSGICVFGVCQLIRYDVGVDMTLCNVRSDTVGYLMTVGVCVCVFVCVMKECCVVCLTENREKLLPLSVLCEPHNSALFHHTTCPSTGMLTQ